MWRSLEATSCVGSWLKRQEDSTRGWRRNDEKGLCLSRDHFCWQEKKKAEADRALIVPRKRRKLQGGKGGRKLG